MAEQPVSLRDRAGLVIYGATTSAAVENIVAAEAGGVRQVWMTQGAAAPDTLAIYAAASQRTTTVGLGTAIVPTYPRHPLALAQQALAVADLAPDRLRLGVGPSHRATIEGVYGLPMPTPLDHLREYLAVLRGLLWEGQVDFQGRYFQVRATLPRPPRVPLLISALREHAFHLAGEVSDGALSWLCPTPYLFETALPALRAGAAAAGRSVPPLVAHVPVALSTDRGAVQRAARQAVGRYAGSPFYARMFADAGFPIAADGTSPDALLETLVVAGDEETVRARLLELLARGLDEVLVMLVPVADETAERARLARLLGQS